LYKSFYFYYSWRCFKNSKMTLSLIILVFIHFVVHNLSIQKLSPVLKCALGHFKHDCDYRKHTLFHMTWLLVLVAWTCVFFMLSNFAFNSQSLELFVILTWKHASMKPKRVFVYSNTLPLSWALLPKVKINDFFN
jgi:hypothetical protein